ncbi:hypothetical protein FOA52_014763 [Chlamydomonas sp. UWO 241]|nr:hypothetical protein FOA52_014763 [Chlamydomonas sp. UWO 241]
MAARSVVLLASSSDAPISAWDVQTGTQLTQYKGNASPRNGLCSVGRDYVVGAQTGKDALQFWTWHKDQALQRSFIQERATCVAASRCGSHLAAGAASGAVYLWEVASGRLLRSWGAHYKGVSCLSFNDSGSVLFSGAEDTLACAWLLAELLDVTQDPSDAAYLRPQPLHSWSEHTLPVTSLCVGSGEASCLVVTASLDRTVKVHSMADGRLLRSAALPAALNCVVMDAGEATLFAGGADGAVYEVSLVGAAASGSSGTSGAVSAARSDIVRVECHSRGVNALSLSLDGEVMVSGSDDGTACVWDLRSRQAVQVIQGPGKLPVTSVLVIPQPEHMVAGPAGGSGGSSGRQGPRRPQPLAPLVKYPGQPGTLKSWEGPAVVIDGSVPYEGIAQACGLWGTASSLPPAPHSSLTCSLLAGAYDAPPRAAGASDGVAGPSGMMEVDAHANGGGGEEALVQEVARLKEELKQAQAASHKWQVLHTQLSKEAGKAEAGKAQAAKGGKRKL